MIKKQKIIVGNWKMNPDTRKEAEEILISIDSSLVKSKNTKVIICPPFIYIPLISQFPKPKFELGAQNVFHETSGSFTGEISASMLKSLGVSYVIVGHSEYRNQGETDEEVNKKVLLLLKEGITPIICIGEKERDAEGVYLSFIRNQIEKALSGVQKKFLESVIIAYEPVWAIGSTEAMKPNDVHQTTLFIKKVIVDTFKMKTHASTLILYGGSVDSSNFKNILNEGDADGLLIGRQSLEAKNFLDIINNVE